VPVVADPICANEAHAPAVALAFDITGTGPGVRSGGSETDVHTVLRSRAPGASEGSTTTVVQQAAAVRRLTPRECERLQGLPDDWTLVPWRAGLAADGPRYKAIGNGQAVNVMRWIGRRIELVEHIGAVSLRVSVK
jgi:DNA (cytosine-5)-methyltransferase 1